MLGAHEVETDARSSAARTGSAGPGASLRCGLRALGPEVEAAVVVLADGPDLAPEAVDRVVASWREGGDVVAASYGGERGHPVLLARRAWDAVPDEGARALAPRLVACDDLGAPGDVDFAADLPGRIRTAADELGGGMRRNRELSSPRSEAGNARSPLLCARRPGS